MRIQKQSNNILIRISASILEALIFNDYLIKIRRIRLLFLENWNTEIP